METSLAGKLLVATPELTDDLFSRSVILMLQHDEETAEGVILNKPLETSVDDVLPGWQQGSSEPQRVFQGGPVQLDSALGLVSIPGDDTTIGIKRLFGSVGLVDLDAPPVVVMPEVAGLRIYAGYSGWEGDQLEREIREGAWFVVPAEAGDAFSREPDALWTAVLRRQRSTLALVSTFPADPSLN